MRRTCPFTQGSDAGARQGNCSKQRDQPRREAEEDRGDQCGGWRLAKALSADLHFIQRAQKSHRKYWDRSAMQCHMEEGWGARGVKAGDLHADSQPSVLPPPQVGTAPYVPIRKGSGTSLVLRLSSPTVPDSTVCTQAQRKTCCRDLLLGGGWRWLGGDNTEPSALPELEGGRRSGGFMLG